MVKLAYLSILMLIFSMFAGGYWFHSGYSEIASEASLYDARISISIRDSVIRVYPVSQGGLSVQWLFHSGRKRNDLDYLSFLRSKPCYLPDHEFEGGSGELYDGTWEFYMCDVDSAPVDIPIRDAMRNDSVVISGRYSNIATIYSIWRKEASWIFWVAWALSSITALISMAFLIIRIRVSKRHNP